MDPNDSDPAHFHCNFKEHSPGETPLIRPIISGSGSTTKRKRKDVIKERTKTQT